MKSAMQQIDEIRELLRAMELHGTRQEQALRQILGWRELRSGANEFPIERIEAIARDALLSEQDYSGLDFCLCRHAIEQAPGRPTVHDPRCKFYGCQPSTGEVSRPRRSSPPRENSKP